MLFWFGIPVLTRTRLLVYPADVSVDINEGSKRSAWNKNNKTQDLSHSTFDNSYSVNTLPRTPYSKLNLIMQFFIAFLFIHNVVGWSTMSMTSGRCNIFRLCARVVSGLAAIHMRFLCSVFLWYLQHDVQTVVGIPPYEHSPCNLIFFCVCIRDVIDLSKWFAPFFTKTWIDIADITTGHTIAVSRHE